MALTSAERVRAHRARQKIQAATPPGRINQTAAHLRFQALIAEAQVLATQINEEAMSALETQPLTLETAKILLALKGKDMRISFAPIYQPT